MSEQKFTQRYLFTLKRFGNENIVLDLTIMPLCCGCILSEVSRFKFWVAFRVFGKKT